MSINGERERERDLGGSDIPLGYKGLAVRERGGTSQRGISIFVTIFLDRNSVFILLVFVVLIVLAPIYIYIYIGLYI